MNKVEVEKGAEDRRKKNKNKNKNRTKSMSWQICCYFSILFCFHTCPCSYSWCLMRLVAEES